MDGRGGAADTSGMFALILAFALLSPAPAHATAGFAETHSELRYNRLASLDWIHPGDGCDCGEFCFQIVRAESRYRTFRGLVRSLGKINAPAESGRPLVFAQSCADGNWIVYDLAAEEYLVDTPYYESALAVWRSSGLAEPRFADARHGARGLHQSWGSLVEGVAWTGLMFLPLVVMLLLPVCLVASIALLSRYRRTRRGAHLAWALIVLLPTLPGWWVGSVVFRRRILHRGG